MEGRRSQFDLAAINAKPGRLNLARFFVIAFLVLLCIDFVSTFTVWTIAFPTWQFTLNGGGIAFQDSDPISYQYRSAVNFAFWLPIWDPTCFYFSRGKGPAGHFALSFPIWLLSVPCAIAAMIAFHQAVRRADLCAHCKYSILTLSACICPECGKPITPGLSPLPVSKTLRGFSDTYKAVVRLSLSLAGIGLVLVLGMRVLFWMLTVQTTIIIPNGYVGSLLFVQDEKGAAPEGGWGKYIYHVPESGVLRVTRIDVIRNYPGTPSGGIDFIFREENGTIISRMASEDGLTKSLHLNGPFGSPGITEGFVGFGPSQLPRQLRISGQELQRLRTQGVPVDYIAPHEIHPGAWSPSPESLQPR